MESKYVYNQSVQERKKRGETAKPFAQQKVFLFPTWVCFDFIVLALVFVRWPLHGNNPSMALNFLQPSNVPLNTFILQKHPVTLSPHMWNSWEEKLEKERRIYQLMSNRVLGNLVCKNKELSFSNIFGKLVFQGSWARTWFALAWPIPLMHWSANLSGLLSGIFIPAPKWIDWICMYHPHIPSPHTNIHNLITPINAWTRNKNEYGDFKIGKK